MTKNKGERVYIKCHHQVQVNLNMIIIPITVMGFVVNIPDISDTNGLPSTSEHVEHLRWEPLFAVIYVTCVQF